MPLALAFFIALFVSSFSLALLPNVSLMAFSPFLALACLRLPLIKTLWLALLVGLCLDLLSSEERLGTFMIAYLITILFLHRRRNHFFEDKIVTFTLYGTIISSLTTLWIALIALTSESAFTWSFEFFAIDLVLLPVIDGLSGFLLFILPHLLFQAVRKIIRLRFGHTRLGKHT